MPEEARFAPPKGPQDLWAAFLFVANLASTVILASVVIPKVDLTTMRLRGTTPPPPPPSGSQPPFSITFGPAAISAVVAAAFASMAFSFCYLLLMKSVPKQLVKLTFWCSAFTFCALGVFLFLMTGSIFLGVVMLFIGGLYVMTYRMWRKRMPFAAVMLATVSSVTNKYGGMLFVAVVGLIAQLAYVVGWAITAVCASVYFGAFNSTSSSTTMRMTPAMYILWLYLVFSLYWTTQVIRNVIHTTLSGVFASFYFLSGSPAGMPAFPTLAAFKRTTTTSFGSVCYGSLLVAAVQTLRAAIDQARQSDRNNGLMAFIVCCVDCLLACVQGMLEALNHYAFVQVAIYGKPYCRAAKDTWHMIKTRGVDLILNDSLIGNVLGFGGLWCACITTLVAWGAFAAAAASMPWPTTPAARMALDVTMIIALLISAVIGVIVFSVVGSVIESGTSATFVCLAEDPLALQQTKPELWQKVRETYPNAAFISMYH
ncbi:plasma-membrane choline transporter-domain-containing protein [Catenaria anguillulae PL171]|uniref:Protein PNS1 n=1 Tax=Catenaria anguillulae PL171 TaxID=765915 RepID=A0A1Y2HUC1_9FUNG|nr:plasma-membrane choline transporter-domain-containing protein [Catenaria anguillulae PL171]